MGIRFHELPTNEFSVKLRPAIARLNKELREIFGLEGAISQPILNRRSDQSVTRGGARQVHVTRISSGFFGETLFGNPSALVGLTAVNGVKETAMRSDGAPPIDQAIAPTWTGRHAFESEVGHQVSIGFDSSNFTKFTAENDDDFIIANATGNFIKIKASGRVGINTIAALARLDVTDTGVAQLRLSYDTSNYFTSTIASDGATTFDAVGTAPIFKFSDDVQISSNKELRFADNGNYVGFEAPALAADQIWVLPAADGNASEFLQTDGAGALTWAAASTAPAGSDTHVQYNDGGAFGGESTFIYDKTIDTLTLDGVLLLPGAFDTHIADGNLHVKKNVAIGSTAPSALYGLQVRGGTTYVLYQSGSGTNKLSGATGIGTNPISGWRLNVLETQSASGTKYGVFSTVNNSSSTNSAKGVGFAVNANYTSNAGALLKEATGAECNATYAVASGDESSGTGIVRGGKFSAIIPVISSATLGSNFLFEGGLFVIKVTSSTTNNTIDTAACIRASMEVGNTGNVVTNGVGLSIDSPFATSANGTITNFRGIYIRDMSRGANGPAITNYDGVRIGDQSDDYAFTTMNAIIVEAQDGANKAVTAGNVVMEGDGFDEGHIQLNTGHIWSSSGVLSFSNGAPTTDTDDDFRIGSGYALLANNNELRFADNGNYVGFEAPALSADQIWVLPAADGTSGQKLSTDGSGNLAWSTVQWSKGITVENPTSSEDITMFFTNEAITVTEMRAVLLGSSTPSVTWTIRHHATDRSNAGAEVVTGGTTTTSTTSGSDVTSFNDATIPADSFVWFETTAQSGTVTEIHISLIGTTD